MNVPEQYGPYVRIGLVLLASGGCFLLSFYAKSLTEHNVFPVLFPGVVLSAWIGGRLGGLVSTVALALGTAYFHMPPDPSFRVADPADLIRLGTFILSGMCVAWLSGVLKENHGFMMATLTSIGEGVIAADCHGRIRFLNPIAVSLTGWSQKDAKGLPLGEVFQSVYADTNASVPIPAPDMLREEISLPENIYLISKSGNKIPIDQSFAPVQTDSGRIVGSILVFRDATRRRQTEAALLQAERERLQAQRMEAIGRLAGGLAHDFNNLLTLINGYAELLLKQIDSGGLGRTNVEEIRKAGERAAGLTRQLLVFSRGQPAKLEVVDLNHVVSNFEKMLRRLIGEDIELAMVLADESLRVRADVGQIEQVIMNLGVNARDAMPSGGRLTIETGRRASEENSPDPGKSHIGYAVLKVADTGIGIDPKAQPHLFEPFFTTKEVGKGTGLGLSIIYGIVKGHKGYLQVESEPGRGSIFEVRLPLVESLPQEIRTPTSPQEAPRGAGTILLVEDDPEVRNLMREILTGLGYFVLEAALAEDAILAAQNYTDTIDLMVSDIVMPGISGFELSKRLAPIRPDMRVLYVSGYPDHDTTTRALGDSVAYLQKPFVPAELASRVAEMIRHSKKVRVD